MKRLFVLLLVGSGIAFAGVKSLGIVAYGGGSAATLTRDDKPRAEINAAPVASDLAEEAKYVRFGKPELAVERPDAAAQGVRVSAVVTADVDRDGVDDIVSADVAGRVRVVRGKASTLFPGSQRSDASGRFFGSAFGESTAVADLGESVETLVAGDFNADGPLDLVAFRAGADRIIFLRGDGRGDFAKPFEIVVGGSIRAIAAGEIGRPDGLADLAVGFSGPTGSFVAVYANMDGALARSPEVFKVPAAPVSIVLGQLDNDPYADVAVAGGNILTVIHERGDPYSLAAAQGSEIVRPPAIVRSMNLPFSPVALAIGNLDGERGTELAALSTDGTIFELKPDRRIPKPKTRPQASVEMAMPAFRPSGAVDGRLAVSRIPLPTSEAAAEESGLLMADTNELKELGREEIMRRKVLAKSEALAALSPAERANREALDMQAAAARRADAKRLFKQTLSAKPIEFAKWNVAPLTAGDARLGAAASSGARLFAARVSTSGYDDLVVTAASGEVFAIGRWRDGDGAAKSLATVVPLATQTAPAVTALRVNSDARGDLVMFSNSSADPFVMLSGPGVVLTVNTTDDGGGGNCRDDGQPCTLRRALFWANLIPDSTIVFNIPGSGVQTIHITSALPDIVRGMTIDATTQPGFIDKPLIEISGDLLNGGAIEGLRVTRSNVVIRGLAINQMPGNEQGASVVGGSGIVLLSYIGRPVTTNVTIEGNFLGTDATGTLAKGNDGNGVQLYDVDYNTIGGRLPQARNILSGNGNPAELKNGVGFAVTGGNFNDFFNNYVGTDVSGTLKISNTDGAFVTGQGNRIGGDQPGEGNVISGNGTPPNELGSCSGVGLRIVQLYTIDDAIPLTDATNVKGNLVGLTANGFAPLGNCTTGIASTGNINTIIGSIIGEGRNTVSANKYDGIWCGFNDSAFFPISGGCYIIGNDIGTNINGTAAIPNTAENSCVGFCLVTETVWAPTSGIDFAVIGSPGGTTENGPCTGFCNLISGNYGPWLNGGGIQKSGFGYGLIANNYIGTNRNGDAALPNFGAVFAYYGSAVIGTPFVGENGELISGGNLIAGNHAIGVGMTAIDPGGIFFVKGNSFGLSVDGLTALPNGIGGTESSALFVQAQGGTSVAVGGAGPFERNIITNEASDGPNQRGHGINIFTSGTVGVYNNLIGIDRGGNPAQNSGAGIRITGKGRTQIGGADGYGNIIANNGGPGVLIYDYNSTTQSFKTSGVSVRGNEIRNNGGLGIDITNFVGNGLLVPDGVTENDCQDFDEGPNGLQNYPELFAPVQNSNGTLRIDTILKSLPSQTYTIDYYLNNQPDATNHGEGQIFLGAASVTTNGNSFASVSFNTNQQLATTVSITATATDEFGNTSEFACAAGVCTATQTFEDAVANFVPFCIQPIIVNVNTDEPDLDAELPVQQRDGLCDVDANTAGEQCTLRAAIQEANARPGFDLVNFEIPGGGIQTITIPNGSILPDIKEKMQLDGLSQSSPTGDPLIELKGGELNNTIPLRGLTIATSDVYVRGLSITQFVTNIAIARTDGPTNNNRVERCWIGVKADGSISEVGLSTVGIAIIGDTTVADGNQIGSFNNGNVIANNENGIVLAGANARNNVIAANKIGTRTSGTTALPNRIGIVIGSGAHHNTIGGDIDGEGNLVSGNQFEGISMGTNAHHNTIQGNLIGTDVTGENRLANGAIGIKLISGANNNVIGGNFARRNVISGNNGLDLPDAATEILVDDGVSQNKFAGNYIGLNKTGDRSLGGKFGIAVYGSDNTIGGDESSPNVIAVSEAGIVLTAREGQLNTATVVSYNRIGTKANGTESAGQGTGIIVRDNVMNTRIDRNLISGNQAFGVALSVGTSQSTVSNNRIGTNAAGNGALANGLGVVVTSSTGNTITGNLVSGNLSAGVFIGDDFLALLPELQNAARHLKPVTTKRLGDQQFVSDNLVTSNLIGMSGNGLSAIPNAITGITLGENARQNRIGGNRSAGEGNYIGGHNTSDTSSGIYVGSIWVDSADERLPKDNTISGNFIGFGRQGGGGSSLEPLPNTYGIIIRNAAANFIGANFNDCPSQKCDATQFGNYIGNCAINGILYEGEGNIDNYIRGNIIGAGPGFTLESLANNGGAGILYRSSNRSEVSENIVVGSGGDGIRVEEHHSFTLTDNQSAANEGNGIAIVQQPQPRPQEKQQGGAFLSVLKGNSVGQILSGIRMLVAPNSLNGIELNNAKNVVVGRSESGRRTVVTSNLGDGIKITGTDTENVEITNTNVGTDDAGTPDLGNGGDGIKVEDAANVVIGGVGNGNTVAGNSGNGISATNAYGTKVVGNSVGVVPGQQTVKLPNVRNGLVIRNSASTIIGGIAPAVSNTISGNNQNGILITGPSSSANQVLRNILGTDSARTPGLGNQLNGIRVTGGANSNQIGDETSEHGNTISGNGANGVTIDNAPDEFAPSGLLGFNSVANLIGFNQITGNFGKGINTGAGVNDPADADEGPNRLQNYPTIQNVVSDATSVSFSYRVDTAPANADYGTAGLVVRFWIADARGDGASTELGTAIWTVADYNSGGLVPVTFPLPPGPAPLAGVRVTGTATDAAGNTSEFAPAFAPTAAMVSVAGTVRAANGAGIGGVIVTITGPDGAARNTRTNSFGRYQFDGVESGATYSVAVTSKRYSFDPPTLVMNVSDAILDADFSALE